MDFVSLSPADDNLFRRDHDHHSWEADNFPLSPYPRPRFQWPKSRLGRERVRRSTLSHPWFASHLGHLYSTSMITIVRTTTPPCLPATAERRRNFLNRKSLSPQFADSFPPERQSLPPSFRQNNLASILKNHWSDSSHSRGNFKRQRNSVSPIGHKAKLSSTLMLARSVNTSSLPGDIITRTPTRRDGSASVKTTLQLNTTAQRPQKEQGQKGRQRSSARSNDSRVLLPPLVITPLQMEHPDWFQDHKTPIRFFITGTSSLKHQEQRSWRPLPSSSRYHNSQFLWLLVAPGCQGPYFLFPATTADCLNRASWHRDASALCFLFPATTAPCFNRGSWHRDASALCFLFPATTAPHFNRGSWHRDASALCCLFPATTADCFNRNFWLQDPSALYFLFPATTAACFNQNSWHRDAREYRGPLHISRVSWNHSWHKQVLGFTSGRKAQPNQPSDLKFPLRSMLHQTSTSVPSAWKSLHYFMTNMT